VHVYVHIIIRNILQERFHCFWKNKNIHVFAQSCIFLRIYQSCFIDLYLLGSICLCQDSTCCDTKAHDSKHVQKSHTHTQIHTHTHITYTFGIDLVIGARVGLQEFNCLFCLCVHVCACVCMCVHACACDCMRVWECVCVTQWRQLRLLDVNNVFCLCMRLNVCV